MTSTETKSRVSRYWRSLDELENSSEFKDFVHREFPKAASELPEGVSRRRWMQLMGASFTLAAVQGCRWQTEEIVPFAERPEGYVPGSHEKYATSVYLAGSPRHLLVTKVDGRPIKVDGNPQHPSGQAGSDVYSQALTLGLYDPDRQREPIRREGKQQFVKSWDDFVEFAAETLERLGEKNGQGLAVLAPPATSVALRRTMAQLFDAMPAARLFEYEPLSRENELQGAELALGRRVRTHYKLADADVIATFDADLLQSSPDATAHANAFADRREPDAEKNSGGMNRLYSIESQFSTTGGVADHRLPIRSSAIPALLSAVRDAIKQGEAPAPSDDPKDYQAAFVRALVSDLLGAKGRSLVVVGSRQSPQAHAIAHEISALLENVGKTVVYTEEPAPVAETGSLADLVGEVAAQRVDTLLILGGNPVYNAPADLDVVDMLARAPHSIHLSQYHDETSRLCEWSLPEAHPLESWGDAVAWDGTVSIAQPMIEPLLNGWSALELMATLISGPGSDPQQMVRDAIAEAAGGLDDKAWHKVLHDGWVEGSASQPVDVSLATGDVNPPPAAGAGEALELVFTPSSATYDGEFANNGWLQETPDFMTKITWDNAAIVSPATAAELGATQGELVEFTVGERTLGLPIYIQPGTANGSVGIALGYGREAAGRVGGMVHGEASRPVVDAQWGNWWWPEATPVDFDSYKLRTTANLYVAAIATARPTGSKYLLATTQDHHAIDELGLEEIFERSGDLVREASQEFYEEHNDFDFSHAGAHVPDVELWNELTHDDGRAWGMAIDLNRCIGCNACSVACQAENNVPVVGKDQVARGREMHWIRIDRYFRGREVVDSDGNKQIDYENPNVLYQPLTCQHCETAPCETVCPVAATIHSDEGLNDMVYNRCVGTRYCANNCPFKVRRFNFFNYTKRFDEANSQLMQLVTNPEVTVRSRGVMEKCTFCTQRISHARIEAKNEGRPIRDGDVQTACQEACPTQAIVFGDLEDKDSEVAKWHEDRRAYTLLDGLRVKPRNKYLARIRNVHPDLKGYLDMVDYSEFLHDSHGDGHGDGEHAEEHEEAGAAH